MKPIIFCDMHFTNNIENFIFKNLDVLLRNGYKHYVYESSARNGQQAIIDLIELRNRINKDIKIEFKALGDDWITDITASIKLLTEAIAQGFNIHTVENTSHKEFLKIEELKRKNNGGVFAHIGKSHCKDILPFTKYHYIYFRSREDDLYLERLEKKKTDDNLPFLNIEDGNLENIIRGDDNRPTEDL